MGTQQLLLIILGVIIVGISIAVGITMFRNQAYNDNQQALAGELQDYASQCIQFFKTPTSQGGAGQNLAIVTPANMAAFIGFTPNTPYAITSDNGEYRISAYNDTDGTVVLVALGNEQKSGKYPKVITTVNLTSNSIITAVSAADSF